MLRRVHHPSLFARIVLFMRRMHLRANQLVVGADGNTHELPLASYCNVRRARFRVAALGGVLLTALLVSLAVVGVSRLDDSEERGAPLTRRHWVNAEDVGDARAEEDLAYEDAGIHADFRHAGHENVLSPETERTHIHQHDGAVDDDDPHGHNHVHALENQVHNPSFEQPFAVDQLDLETWWIDGKTWTIEPCEGGVTCLGNAGRMNCSNVFIRAAMQFMPFRDPTPHGKIVGLVLRVSSMGRGVSVQAAKGSPFYGMLALVVFKDATRELYHLDFDGAEEGFRRRQRTVTIGENKHVAYVVLMLTCYGYKGSVWFDDVALVPIVRSTGEGDEGGEAPHSGHAHVSGNSTHNAAYHAHDAEIFAGRVALDKCPPLYHSKVADFYTVETLGEGDDGDVVHHEHHEEGEEEAEEEEEEVDGAAVVDGGAAAAAVDNDADGVDEGAGSGAEGDADGETAHGGEEGADAHDHGHGGAGKEDAGGESAVGGGGRAQRHAHNKHHQKLISIVTQATMDRLENLRYTIGTRWPGDVFIAVFVPRADAPNLSDADEEAAWREQLDVARQYVRRMLFGRVEGSPGAVPKEAGHGAAGSGGESGDAHGHGAFADEHFHDEDGSGTESIETNAHFHVQLVYPSTRSYLEYPINYLRNLGLRQADSAYVFLLDGDFVPSPNFVKRFRDAVETEEVRSLGDAASRTAFVVPAFELTKVGKWYEKDAKSQKYLLSQQELSRRALELIPRDKESIVRLTAEGRLMSFQFVVKPNGHGLTNYTRWFTASLPYRVDLPEERTTALSDYEPYLVLKRTPELPMFDERFTGFGMNKITLMLELNYAGYDYMVLPECWTTHVSHNTTDYFKTFLSDVDSRLLNRVQRFEFLFNMRRRYGNVKDCLSP